MTRRARPCSCVTRNEECEEHFLEKVKQLAKLNGWLVYHTRDSRESDPGFPDLVLVRERVLFWELKREKAQTSPEQREWIDRLDNTRQCAVAVMRPHHWPEIERTLQRGT